MVLHAERPAEDRQTIEFVAAGAAESGAVGQAATAAVGGGQRWVAGRVRGMRPRVGFRPMGGAESPQARGSDGGGRVIQAPHERR